MTNEIVFDIEANGLEPTLVHCWSATGGLHGTTKESFQREVLDSGATLVGHNILSYDVPVLERLWGLDFSGVTLVDTLVLSRLARPDRNGGHGLAQWGQTLGYPKVVHEDWEHYSPAMKKRCDVDVEINEMVLRKVREELRGFSDESIQLETEIFKVISDQCDYGWPFDEHKAILLTARLKDEQKSAEREIRERFTPLATPLGEVQPKVKANGELSKVGTKFLGDAWNTLVGPCTRVSFPEFNPGSNDQIARYLQRYGWEPTQLTPTGKPIVDESTLKHVDIPEAQLILRYKNLGKMATMIESWIEAQDDEDGRVRGYVNSCGAVTSRMSHSKPNLAQVPARGPDGKKCRELFTVDKGYTLVGADASGLELRMLAHYMADPEYITTVVEGDVHTVNQHAAGLETRDRAKTFIYAFLYGAGDLEIAEVSGSKSKAHGRKLKQRFLAQTPALAALIKRVQAAAARGYLIGLDGRKVYVRSTYAALNTLLQSGGAIYMKRQQLILANKMKAAGIYNNGAMFVGTIHDEQQTEVRDDLVAQYTQMASDSFVEAGEYYNLRCPMAGEYQTGKTWAETH